MATSITTRDLLVKEGSLVTVGEADLETERVVVEDCSTGEENDLNTK